MLWCESRNLLALRRQLHQLGKQLAEDSKKTGRPLRINFITLLLCMYVCVGCMHRVGAYVTCCVCMYGSYRCFMRCALQYHVCMYVCV